MIDVTVNERRSVAIASIMARQGTNSQMVGAALGVEVLDCKGWAGGPALTLLGYSPGCWLAFSEPEPEDWVPMLQGRLDSIASVADQSSAYSILRLSGGDVRRLLQRGLAIDLHPSSFKINSAAVTQIAHIGVIVWQVDAAPIFDIAIPRSLKQSFQRWLNNEICLMLD